MFRVGARLELNPGTIRSRLLVQTSIKRLNVNSNNVDKSNIYDSLLMYVIVKRNDHLNPTPALAKICTKIASNVSRII